MLNNFLWMPNFAELSCKTFRGQRGSLKKGTKKKKNDDCSDSHSFSKVSLIG